MLIFKIEDEFTIPCLQCSLPNVLCLRQLNPDVASGFDGVSAFVH